ncbi:MAG: hypothetical protein AAGL17_07370, partial [Cyanobacteria bacterium J06576_12]
MASVNPGGGTRESPVSGMGTGCAVGLSSPTHCSPLGAADNLSVYLHHSPQKDVEVRDERPTAQPVPIPETGLSL